MNHIGCLPVAATIYIPLKDNLKLPINHAIMPLIIANNIFARRVVARATKTVRSRTAAASTICLLLSDSSVGQLGKYAVRNF